MKEVLDNAIHALGNLCKELRTGLNCTSTEFSKIIGICEKTIARLECYQFINLYSSLRIIIPCIIYFSKQDVTPILINILLKHGANITHLTDKEFADLRTEDALELIIENLHDDYEKRGVIPSDTKKAIDKVCKKRKKKS